MQTYILRSWPVNSFLARLAMVVITVLLSALLLPAVAQHKPVKGTGKKIDLVKVKMKDLVDAHIAAHKGKVVVIAVWGYFSVPDKELFVEFIQLHQTYADEGLVCMSVSVDPNEEHRKRALKFLQDKKANFANFWLEDGIEDAQEHWRFEPTPAIIVYGRDGKLAKVFNLDDANKDPFTRKDVEEFLKSKLTEKWPFSR